MNARVLFFARVRDLVGRDQLELQLPDGASVADVRAAILRQCPELTGLLSRCMIAVNQQYASDQSVVPPNAEVACIPPVSGGSS